ncbi:hypothetical protein DPEC_G00174160 [Dallia pectoralis]|uniref:Uncharacterized protein n=1 Tax=Dallia pectoralis TaxID=75939 RepID=A0ACC2GEF9_DALPE|nr:hypothetical protein DPEC_G00174160 [Dallia pectoralis]
MQILASGATGALGEQMPSVPVKRAPRGLRQKGIGVDICNIGSALSRLHFGEESKKLNGRMIEKANKSYCHSRPHIRWACPLAACRAFATARRGNKCPPARSVASQSRHPKYATAVTPVSPCPPNGIPTTSPPCHPPIGAAQQASVPSSLRGSKPPPSSYQS